MAHAGLSPQLPAAGVLKLTVPLEDVRRLQAWTARGEVAFLRRTYVAVFICFTAGQNGFVNAASSALSLRVCSSALRRYTT